MTGTVNEPEGDVRVTLLENYNRCKPGCGHDDCVHGAFSPHGARTASIKSLESRIGYGSMYPDGREEEGSLVHEIFGDAIADGVLGHGGEGQDAPMSATKRLAVKYGIKGKRRM